MPPGALCAVGSTVHSSPLATGLGSRSRATQLCKQEAPSRTVPERHEAKVGRSSDDAQRALLRLIQPANRVREPRVSAWS